MSNTLKASDKSSGIHSALLAWKEVLGDEGVIADQKTLSYYNNTTYKTDNNSVAVIKPKNSAEVQQCMRIANQYKTPIYPISRGNNWGYGSRVVQQDNCVVMSLERMNRITDYNEEMSYITVEPGVTFQQVYDFLENKNSNLIAPAIGSTKKASLIGNALERGVGKGIYGDRFQHCCNIEAILPNGECIKTGFGNIENAHSKNLFRWGVGPTIDGLFSQSNFGIVTSMTFWLTKKPEHFQVIFYFVKDNTQLEQVIEALRKLRLEGTITTTSTLSNSHRVLSMKSQFPWKDTDENELLPSEYVEKIQNGLLRGAMWVGDDAIMAPTKAIGKARAKRVKEVLGKTVSEIIFIDKTKAKIWTALWRPIKFLTGIDPREVLFFFHNSFYLGKPMEKQLAICYWRKKTPAPEKVDIDRDKCGVISITPSIPFHGKHVSKGLKIMEDIYKKYDFEPNFGLNFMNDRHLIFVMQIIYDRETPGHDAKAMQCYHEILDAMNKAGYPPYRLGIQSMKNQTSTSPEYVSFINKLKTAIDPNNIISPGHYGINGND